MLDFGLARFAEADPDAIGEGVSDSPTLSAHATRVGVILGTAAYMSPEQARGRTVDKRTDIFSFGAVLYEMLTGRQLFKGEDVADTMASVMRSDPDFRALPSELRPQVRELLSRCLEKDPKKRRRDIGDLRADLERPIESLSVETHERRRPAWLAVVGAALLMGATAVVTWNLKPEQTRPIQRFEIALPEGDNISARRFDGTSSLCLPKGRTWSTPPPNSYTCVRSIKPRPFLSAAPRVAVSHFSRRMASGSAFGRAAI